MSWASILPRQLFCYVNPLTTIWLVLSRRLTLRRDKLTYYSTMGRISPIVLVIMFVLVQIYTGQSPLFMKQTPSTPGNMS